MSRRGGSAAFCNTANPILYQRYHRLPQIAVQPETNAGLTKIVIKAAGNSLNPLPRRETPNRPCHPNRPLVQPNRWAKVWVDSLSRLKHCCSSVNLSHLRNLLIMSSSAFQNMDHFLFKLYSRINYELKIRVEPRDFKLYNIQALLARVSDPHLDYPVVHVAGTKGKGSVATMAANILTASGRKTGLFTSPHLQRINQRIVVDGLSITDEGFEAVLGELDPQVNAMDELCADIRKSHSNKKSDQNSNPDDWLVPDPETGLPLTSKPLTFFEIMTAAAMLHFANSNCDAVVLEVGLGGRLDSTNVCEPAVSVITNISLDHTRQLGSTIDKIAFEKAGIIKPGVPVVCGSRDPTAVKVIQDIADERKADMSLLDRDFSITEKRSAVEMSDKLMGQALIANSRIEFDCHGKLNSTGKASVDFAHQDLQLSMLGHHQRTNAALAVAAIETLNAKGDWNVDAEAISKGLLNTQLDGRTQVFGQSPTIVLDVAHNVASAGVLLETMQIEMAGWTSANKRALILAISIDKDCEGIMQILLPAFDRVWVTTYQDNPRGVAADDLHKLANKVAQQESLSIEIDVAATPDLAWQAATDSLEPTDLLCCTGSVFLIAELIDLARAVEA